MIRIRLLDIQVLEVNNGLSFDWHREKAGR